MSIKIVIFDQETEKYKKKKKWSDWNPGYKKAARLVSDLVSEQ